MRNILNGSPVKLYDSSKEIDSGRVCHGNSSMFSSTAFRIYPTFEQEEKMLYILKCLKNIE